MCIGLIIVRIVKIDGVCPWYKTVSYGSVLCTGHPGIGKGARAIDGTNCS